ncbi:MAG: copper resistance protein B [Hyphomonas sp.]|nr:copper resistance protein B [Hyphomonas sp.]
MRPLILSLAAALAMSATATAQEHNHDASSFDEQPWSQADAYFDPAEMAAAREHVLAHNGDQPFGMIMINRAEVQLTDDQETGVWDADAWYGGDINKLYLKTEGEYNFDESELEDAEVQLLWSRAVTSYFDLQAGIRYDFEPDGLAHAALGFQGIAPYWFEVEGTAFLSEEGDITADFEAEYELLLTQRLILQPRAALSLSAQNIPEREIGSGVSSLEAGLRLRYEFAREFAPYVGVEYHGAPGKTGDMIEAAGADRDQTVWVVGLRVWY